MDVSKLMADLDAVRPEVRYGAGKALIALSAADPAAVYPYFDDVAVRLTGSNRILRWNATRILANLTTCDAAKRFDALLETYLRPLHGPELVAAANVLGALPTIAAARPDLAQSLARAAAGIRHARFATPECRLVVIGHALTALRRMLPLLSDTAPVLEFAASQKRARRPKVRREAQAVLAAAEA